MYIESHEMIPQPQLTLALAKFSFATTSPRYTAPIPWTHLISDNNLVVVFEFSSSQICHRSQGPNHRFKILNGQELLVGMSTESANSY